MTLKRYLLSEAAEEDFEKIYDYTLAGYGEDQTLKYLSELDSTLNELVRTPEMGKDRSEIKPGLRSFPKLSHVIFYRVMPDHLRVVRVLHSRSDLIRFLE